MIGIKECVSNVDLIKEEHIKFVGNRVYNVTKFYIDIFELLELLEHPHRRSIKTINSDINNIKNKWGLHEYKRLLQAILKKGMGVVSDRKINTASSGKKKKKGKLSDKESAYIIKYSKKRVKEANNIKVVIQKLTDLLKDYENILSIEFETNLILTQASYVNYKTKYEPIKFLLNAIFDYEEWFSKISAKKTWGPYQLTRRLNLSSCPYCNRQYTFTVVDSSRKIAKPELDHFLPKAQNPLLALSFYNLIPSCHLCNSTGVKGAKLIDYMTHYNPYEKNEKHSLMRFTYTPNTYNASVGLTDELDVEVKYSGDPSNSSLRLKVEGNINLFCLNEIYANHTDTVKEIIRKRHMSGDKYIEILQNTFTSFHISMEEAYRLAYGNYYEEKEFSRRTLSKLTKDIAIELKTIIKINK